MKLTPEQKLANKEVLLLKRDAFGARLAEMRLAEDGLEKHSELTALSAAADAARKTEDDLRDARNASISALQRQIAEIKAKVDDVLQTSNPLIESAEQKRKDADMALYVKRIQLRDDIRDRLFPDIKKADGYYANWIPPAGYIEAYAAKHADEIARKKSRRDAAAKKRGSKRDFRQDEGLASKIVCEQKVIDVAGNFSEPSM